jgi:DNA helicase-2/ATP-dependent DNA helicase PcrA
MTRSSLSLLDISHGAVVAPAGCGKTQLIADALAAHAYPRPILVLTHTNAGVAALRARLSCAGVPRRAYRIATIDGWALRLGSMFPRRSGLQSETLQLRNPGRDYPEIRRRALGLLTSGHISDPLRATYARVLVDEYQDCNRVQHALIELVSDVLPVAVLGDPMQAIFGFNGDPLADWDHEVCSTFPEVATLDTPWRWHNVGEEAFGQWLLDVREHLRRGDGVDLQSAPSPVRWVRLDGGRDDYRRQLGAAQLPPPVSGGSVLILADSRKPHEQRRFASQVPGASAVESVDLKEFVAFADGLDLSATDALAKVVGFAETIMSNLGGNAFLQRVRVLESGRARTPATAAESAALHFKTSPTPSTMADLLEALNTQGGVRVYRPVVLRACFQALRRWAHNPSLGFGETARRVREEYRAGERTVAKRAVGSTLLLKGLEADMAVILDAMEMDARHLYVAMTRGARRLVVCARSARLVSAA